MPTNRKRITRKLKSIVTDNVRHYLETGHADDRDVEVYLLQGNPEQLREKWESQKEVILSDWIVKYPGNRPWAWWLCDAKEPRQRIGGKGQSMNEKYPAWGEYYNKSIPVSWHSIDPDNPPRFESEASYLDRQGLLTTAEKKRLKPVEFKPVQIEN